MTDSVTVKLSKPITHNGEEISELTFHEATVGDMIAGDEVEGDFGKTVAILASMAGVSYEAFKAMRAGDINKVTKATTGLLGNADTPEDSGSE
ncbi:phage tail assembly protein [Devosia naphthalenivorans]|uniref:phage tail assembly protein n=1 Tax=Devosia naphthalenivorans TaxID=2082392 RepID=UPI000D3D18AF|nr:phage tail assembly protein [Devosia naphthalenivorans]